MKSFTSPYNCVAALRDRNFTISIDVSYIILQKVQTIRASQWHRTSHLRSL